MAKRKSTKKSTGRAGIKNHKVICPKCGINIRVHKKSNEKRVSK
jgi:hypothetical protein